MASLDTLERASLDIMAKSMLFGLRTVHSRITCDMNRKAGHRPLWCCEAMGSHSVFGGLVAVLGSLLS